MEWERDVEHCSSEYIIWRGPLMGVSHRMDCFYGKMQLEWMMTRGTPISGNLHYTTFFCTIGTMEYNLYFANMITL